jgi:hypothetical protein
VEGGGGLDAGVEDGHFGWLVWGVVVVVVGGCGVSWELQVVSWRR